MTSAEFEPAILAIRRPQIYALDRAATRISNNNNNIHNIKDINALKIWIHKYISARPS
jgi:hypothetical protein